MLGLGFSVPLSWTMSQLVLAEPRRAKPRLLIWYFPHGLPIEHSGLQESYPPSSGMTRVQPLQLRHDVQAGNGGGVNIFAPLSPYQQQVNLLRGFEYKGYNNHPAISGMLSNGAGASVEHVIANHYKQPVVTLGVIPHRLNDFGPDSQLFHDGSNWVRPEINPIRAAQTLFPDRTIQRDVPRSDHHLDHEFRKLAIGLNIREIETLKQEVRGLTSEENKLSVHLESLQSLADSQKPDLPPSNNCQEHLKLPAVQIVKSESKNGLDENYFLDHINFPKILDAQLEVAAHALLCGSAQIVAIQTMYANAQINFGFMGIAKDHHDPLSHAISPSVREEFAKAQRWLIQRFADRCLKVLNQPDPEDPSHTLLDNTLVYCASEIADGNAHNCNTSSIWINGKEQTTTIPLFTIGSASGALHTGTIFDTNNRSHADLLMTLCQAMGKSVSNFGPNSSGVVGELLS